MKYFMILLSFALGLGCSNIDYDPDSLAKGVPLAPGKLEVEDEYFGSWGEVSMSIDDGDVFSVPMEEALKIERAAKKEDGSYSFLYQITIEEYLIQSGVDKNRIRAVTAKGTDTSFSVSFVLGELPY